MLEVSGGMFNLFRDVPDEVRTPPKSDVSYKSQACPPYNKDTMTALVQDH